MLATLAVPLCAITVAVAVAVVPLSASPQDARAVHDEPVVSTPSSNPSPNPSSTLTSATSSTSVRVTGTVYRYDSAAHHVVLRTSDGLQTIALTAATQIREGTHVLAAAQLGTRLGMRVIVRVREVTGRPEAVSVHVVPPPASHETP